MLATLVFASIAIPKLAFIARFYHPYPDMRISYDRLYVVDWDGRNRRLLSLPGQICSQVSWVGRDMLVYEASQKGAPEKSSLWTIRLPRGKPRLLAEEGFIDKELTFESSRDGVPVVHTNPDKPLGISPASGRLTPLVQRKNPWYDPFKGADGSFVPNRITSASHVYSGTFSVTDENVGSFETSRGQLTMTMPIWVGFHDPQTNRLWVVDYPSMHSQRLQRVRWDKGTIEALFWAGYSLDWRPDRAQVAFATQRDLSPYGPNRQVWTNELWVGVLETGVQRQLTLGKTPEEPMRARRPRSTVPMAWFSDVAVSP